LTRCGCAAPSCTHHLAGQPCGRIYGPGDPVFVCRAPGHAHGAELQIFKSQGGTLPPSAVCPWCACPAIREALADAAPIHAPGGGHGESAEQAALREGAALQEHRERFGGR